MKRRIVLLGTGTGVGKTFVGALLARSLRQVERSVLGLKPIESGIPSRAKSNHLPTDTVPPLGSVALSEAPLSDAATLSAASGLDVGHFRAFPDPVSPHLAARRAGESIRVEDVVEWVGAQERAHPDRALTVVETAGGVLSPLGEATTNFDLALALEPAVFVLIAPDALGVLHDVAATLLACRSLGRVPDLVVLSGARPADASTGANADELMQIVFPRLDSRSAVPPGGSAAPACMQVSTIAAGAVNCESFVSNVLRLLDG